MPCRNSPTPERLALVSSLLADATSPPEQLCTERRCRRPAHHGFRAWGSARVTGDLAVEAVTETVALDIEVVLGLEV
jgi:hypothetical protein